MKKTEAAITAISSLFILLFFYAAFSKWLNFSDFERQMNNQPFSKTFLPLLLYGLPALEILAGLLLISSKTRNIGLYICLILMLSFTVYIILIKINFYGRIPCSCGGIIKTLSWTQHLFLNLFFDLLGIVGVMLYKKSLYQKNFSAIV